MKRWGGQWLKENYASLSKSPPATHPWRAAALLAGPSVRRVIALYMLQENTGAWVAFKMVRRYAMIHGTWPAPSRKGSPRNMLSVGPRHGIELS